ncbi:Inner membrane component of tripartite multidrug resistance system [Labilithrix luteola]|uniref:Inner membrane component of tripartite multidrug resistance system n=1 Tax=Labilithrix luteola TaxID=1391654 RepID=A0A0K1PPR6_9BACT|nr:MFS transporter [Labilithrix luteola]AKU95512.1 Inner membrane component of tripartite multidrug resistance system [Labilithrix luteola]
MTSAQSAEMTPSLAVGDARAVAPFSGGLSIRQRAAVGAAVACVFAAVLQARLTSFALADLQGAFGVGPDEAAWLNTVFAVAEVMAIPPAVWLAGVLSLRRTFVPAAVAFAAVSLLAVRVRDFEMLLVLRALQGLSGGALIPMAMPTFRRKLPNMNRLYAFALYGIVASVPISLAPLIEAWIVENGSFRLVFVPPAVIAGVAALVGVWGFPRQPVNWSELRHPDPLGLALPSIGLGAVLLGIEQANRLDWFASRWVIGMVTAGLLVLVAFIRHELAHPTPAFRLDVFTNRNFTVAIVTMALFRISLMMVAWAIPDFLVRIQSLRPIDFASVFLSMAVPQLVLPFVAVHLVRRFDPRLTIAAALALQCAACLRGLALDANWALDELWPIFVLHGVGQGLFFLPILSLLSLNLDVPHRSSAVVVVNFVRLVGGSAGVSVVGTLLTQSVHFHHNVLNEHLASGAGPAAERLVAKTQQLAARTSGDAAPLALHLVRGVVRRESLVLAYSDVFLMVGAGLLGCVLLQTLLRPVSLEELMTGTQGRAEPPRDRF